MIGRAHVRAHDWRLAAIARVLTNVVAEILPYDRTALETYQRSMAIALRNAPLPISKRYSRLCKAMATYRVAGYLSADSREGF